MGKFKKLTGKDKDVTVSDPKNFRHVSHVGATEVISGNMDHIPADFSRTGSWLAGWATMKTGKTTWRRRFLSLTARKLLFLASDKPGAEIKEEIHLNDFSKIIAVELEDKKLKGHQFHIRTTADDYYVVAK